MFNIRAWGPALLLLALFIAVLLMPAKATTPYKYLDDRAQAGNDQQRLLNTVVTHYGHDPRPAGAGRQGPGAGSRTSCRSAVHGRRVRQARRDHRGAAAHAAPRLDRRDAQERPQAERPVRGRRGPLPGALQGVLDGVADEVPPGADRRPDPRAGVPAARAQDLRTAHGGAGQDPDACRWRSSPWASPAPSRRRRRPRGQGQGGKKTRTNRRPEKKKAPAKKQPAR